ncbi:uncharacterized protein HMPREF1541_05450 [Cyphellophora europaea CBS 101466]|uniref:Uncharacterized protein n=1 Tax=Cyphellophora europaea (strain CBS 101466) TaxID=1220924 RepID=W2RRY9_CYPE1|nr:uncharacterized protein HMPREF1541_05450 [Cyphellophora europaea CBS 101466]ETN39227.1 hypothetical protein HMPREF1541_05450 [Cyphellophora europaea CBS 101466]
MEPITKAGGCPTSTSGPSKTRAGPPPAFERRSFIDKVKRALTPLDASHGALAEQIVVYGPHGVGKRHIAIQAATEICARDGRKLLLVNARTYEAFVPSFLAAYTTLTDQSLAPTDHLFQALHQLKYYLENHRQQWIMVVLDVELLAEERTIPDPTSSDQKRVINWFLPTRGQVIMTGLLGRAITGPSLIHWIQVPGLSPSDVEWYARSECSELLDLARDPCSPVVSDLPMPLDLQIVAANLKLLGCTYRHYLAFYTSYVREVAVATVKDGLWTFYPADVNRQILWDLLADRSRWAIRLLSALTLLAPWAIPLALMQEMPMFKNTIADRLGPALDLLQSLQILMVKDAHVYIHQHLHLWFRGYAHRKLHPNDWYALRSTSAEALTYSMPHFAAKGFYDCWTLVPHIFALNVSILRRKLHYTDRIFTFLTNAVELAVYRLEDQTISYGLLRTASLVSYALAPIPGTHPGDVADLRSAKLSVARAQAFFTEAVADGFPDFATTETEVHRALRYVRHVRDDHDFWRMREQLYALEARTMLGRAPLSRIRKFLDRALDKCGLEASELHHLMSVILNTEDERRGALDHSHEAMLYYAQCYKPDGRPKLNRDAKVVVGHHIKILVKERKWRGALLFIRPLLEEELTSSPHRSTTVWILTSQAIDCYRAMLRLSEAEALLYRILDADFTGEGGTSEGRTHHFVDEIVQRSFIFFLETLVSMSSLYYCHGRLIEAEALLRYVIWAAIFRSVGMAGRADSQVADWYRKLIICLARRRHWSALMQKQLDYWYLFGDHFDGRAATDGLGVGLYSSTETYQRAIWAYEDGEYDEWKLSLAEDEARRAFSIAETSWGNVPERVEDGRDFSSDLDLDGITHAKRSRLLHLLGCDIVGITFVGRLGPQTRIARVIFRAEEGGIDIEFDNDTPKSPPLLPATSAEQTREEQSLDTTEIVDGPCAPGDGVTSAGANAILTQPSQTSELPLDEPTAEVCEGNHNSNANCQQNSTSSTNLQSNGPNTKAHVAESQAGHSEDDDEESNDQEPVRGRKPGNRSSRIRRRVGHYSDTHDARLHLINIWANHSFQRTLPEYWSWCYCSRHRNRSSSINPVELIEGAFLRQRSLAAEQRARPKLQQKKITDSYPLLPHSPKPRPQGCHAKCPCIEANKRGAEEYTALLASLTTWPDDDPTPPPAPKICPPLSVYTGKQRPKGRFVRPMRPPPTLLLDEVFYCEEQLTSTPKFVLCPTRPEHGGQTTWLPAKGECQTEAVSGGDGDQEKRLPDSTHPKAPPGLGTTWVWMQMEVWSVDGRGENYVVPRGTPWLNITLTEDDWSLPVPGRNRWYWRDVTDQREKDKHKSLGEGMGELVSVLTKRKEKIWEYFSRRAFGPAQRVKQERQMEWNSRLPTKLDNVQEEEDEEKGKQREECGEPSKEKKEICEPEDDDGLSSVSDVDMQTALLDSFRTATVAIEEDLDSTTSKEAGRSLDIDEPEPDSKTADDNPAEKPAASEDAAGFLPSWGVHEADAITMD